ncbi:25S rRNA (cytosine-C(5))-methyltransferase NSUN5-like [Euphorbia lathyris]|uniref:25S rRNA (cytosine-C(5))-methyltransferase NSUN5-like n=1 Tax=Euphorbia lathyris TaxID=212925 RepID=UPI003313CF22
MRQEALVFIIVYDILFGQEVSMLGGATEKFIRRHKNALQSALAKLVVSKEVQNVDSLIALYHPSDVSKPCYVRVNTLKSDVDSRECDLNWGNGRGKI